MSNISVKAGSVQTLAGARYFSSKMVDMVGFCFNAAKPEFISPRDAQQIIGWLEGPKIVGEFSGDNMREVMETAMILGLDYVQIPACGKEANFEAMSLNVILEVQVNEDDDISSLKKFVQPWLGKVSYIQWDLNTGFGNWKNYTEKSALGVAGLKELTELAPAIIDVHINEEGLWQLGAEVQPAMLNMTTEPESKTGEKSFDELDPLFELLEDEF